MVDHDYTNNRKIHINKITGETKKATRFSLKTQIIRGMKVKRGTEIWVPYMCYQNDVVNIKRGFIIVDEWFWNQLVFV